MVSDRTYSVVQRLAGFWLTKRLRGPRILILGYHGFSGSDEHHYFPNLFMTRPTFRRRLETLRDSNLRVVPLADAVAAARGEVEIEQDLVALTIDDGWRGVLDVAAPLLHEFGFPATLYLTTYYAENELPVINVLVPYMIRKSRAATGKPVDSAREARSAQSAIERVVGLPRSERSAALAALASDLGLSWDQIERDKTMRLISLDEIEALRSLGVDVQLHSHRHFGTKTLDDRELLVREIETNRRLIEPHTDQPLIHYCYPSGEHHDRQLEWLRALGIESATTTETGLNRVGANPLQLSRFLDREDVSESHFEGELVGIADVLRGARRRLRTLRSRQA